MMFGKKSDVKKHFSSKHPMFSHRLFVEDAPNQITGQGCGKEQSAVQSPQPKVEKPEDAPTKS
jgi:hypothetical protein